MTSMTKLLIVVSILAGSVDASINLQSHAASSFSLNRRSTNILPSRSSSMTTFPQPASSGRRSSTTAFIDPTKVLSSIGTFYRTQPYTSAFVTRAVQGVTADYIAQKSASAPKEVAAEGEEDPQSSLRGGAIPAEFNVKRNLAILLYSGIYQGMGLELIYNNLLPKLCGDSVFYKVLVSMFLVSPFLTLPAAYLFKALVFKESMVSALSQYERDVRVEGLLTTYWKIWIPVQTLTFAVVPQHFRIAFIAAFSFVWMIIFSSISNK